MKKVAFCFDLDGTLTKEEILPQIAKHIDLNEEIEILTSITMQGLIAFAKSFKLRVKLLAAIPISTVKQSVERIRIDQHLKTFVQNNAQNCFIVTGNLDVWVNDFIAENFGCRYFSSLADFEGDLLKGVKTILDKRTAIEQLRKEGFDYIITIGDGMNDCSMFELADKGIAFGGVHAPVNTLIQMSDYVCYESSTLVNLLENLKNHHGNEN